MSDRLEGLRLLTDGVFLRPISYAAVYEMLHELPGVLKMTPLSPPIVMCTETSIHGMQIIAESHIAVVAHVSSESQWHGSIDISTCKPAALDRGKVLGYLRERWGYDHHTVHFLPWETEPPIRQHPLDVPDEIDLGETIIMPRVG